MRTSAISRCWLSLPLSSSWIRRGEGASSGGRRAALKPSDTLTPLVGRARVGMLAQWPRSRGERASDDRGHGRPQALEAELEAEAPAQVGDAVAVAVEVAPHELRLSEEPQARPGLGDHAQRGVDVSASLADLHADAELQPAVGQRSPGHLEVVEALQRQPGQHGRGQIAHGETQRQPRGRPHQHAHVGAAERIERGVVIGPEVMPDCTQRQRWKGPPGGAEAEFDAVGVADGCRGSQPLQTTPQHQRR
ncbi:MAG: hypothetical protein IPG96_17130 [Proteobacteria bacterium]|nr:hypothetical protein [Pseudomonadota bacterium]